MTSVTCAPRRRRRREDRIGEIAARKKNSLTSHFSSKFLCQGRALMPCRDVTDMQAGGASYFGGHRPDAAMRTAAKEFITSAARERERSNKARTAFALVSRSQSKERRSRSALSRSEIAWWMKRDHRLKHGLAPRASSSRTSDSVWSDARVIKMLLPASGDGNASATWLLTASRMDCAPDSRRRRATCSPRAAAWSACGGALRTYCEPSTEQTQASRTNSPRSVRAHAPRGT